MIFVYMDDFGHSGPYFGGDHPRHNTSPVFGFAGLALPEHQVRPFSSFFLQLKSHVCKVDLETCDKPAYRWEKKGTNLFTKRSIEKYPAVRQAGFRLISEIKKRDGFIFYYGREKIRNQIELKSVGLQKTILSNSIRRLDNACQAKKQNFVIVMDQSSSKMELLTTAQKTMFGDQRCKKIVSPPFEVSSHLDQNIQAADWIATLVGRMWAFKVDQDTQADLKPYSEYFWDRLHSVAHVSTVERRSEMKPAKAVRKIIFRRTTIREEIVEIESPPLSND